MFLLWAVLSLALAVRQRDLQTTFAPNPQLIDSNPSSQLIRNNGALDDIVGFFFSGGGYVSHGEGALLTWGWLPEEKSKEALIDLYSNLVVATTSGGGWFFNDLMY